MRPRTAVSRLSIPVLAAGLAQAAACDRLTGPPLSGACIGTTNVAGVLFVVDATASAQDRVFTQGDEVIAIARRRPCQDQGGPNVTGVVRLLSGESDAFNAGTKLCAIEGESPTLRLMVCDRDPAEPPIIVTSLHDEPIL